MSELTPSTLRIGKRYRPTRLAASYDAIIIGSGMSGLTAGALLSDLGWRVAVMEQHYTAGGYTHSYDRNGYEWDVGVHYVGDMGADTMARRLMDYLTDGELRWAAMANNYDRFYIGDKVYEAMAGKDAFRANLIKDFPAEIAAIDRYLKLLSAVGKAMPWVTVNRLLSPWQKKLLRPVLKRKIPDFLFQTTWEVLTGLTRNRDLIAVLTGQYGDNGLPPKQSAFMIHALIARHYLYGGYYPVGGSWRIADTILPRIRAAGGEVFTYAKVEEILIKKDRVFGVRMQDGTEIPCPRVISSAGVINTFKRLLPEAISRQHGYLDKLSQVRPSIAHLGLYIGVQGTAEELSLPKTNLWIYPDNDYDAAIQRFVDDPSKPFPVVYISFPSAKDPSFGERHPGRSTIEIVAPAPYAWFAQWKNTIWGKRGEDYDRLKMEFGERLLEHLYEKLPQLRGKIDYYEVSTPLSTEWFCAYDQGELYGLDHDTARFQQDWLQPKTSIPGLWLTGQDILSCGVVGAMMAGVMTTTAVAGVRKTLPLLKQILKKDLAQSPIPRLA